MGYAANFLIRAGWFIAMEIGVSSIPVSEVCISWCSRPDRAG